MTAIILPRKHYAQPQGRVQLADWARPDRSVVLLGSMPGIDVATGTMLQVAGAPSTRVIADGVLFEPGGRIGCYYKDIGPELNNKSAYILFAVANRVQYSSAVMQLNFVSLDSASYGSYSIIGYKDTNAQLTSFIRPNNQYQALSDSVQHTPGTTTVVGVYVRTGHKPVMCFRRGDSSEVMRLEGGNVVTNAAFTARSVVFSGSAYQVALPSPPSSGTSPLLAGAYLCQEDVSAEMLFDLVANPYSLFRADPVRIYSFPSGPIIPTFSGLTTSHITSSGARHSLTLTY